MTRSCSRGKTAAQDVRRAANESQTTQDHASTACCDIYTGTIGAMQHSVTLLAVEDYTNKYKVRLVERVCGAF